MVHSPIFYGHICDCGFFSGYAPSTKFPRHGVTKPPYMVPRFTILNDKQKRKVMKKVLKIYSDIPIYVAVMQSSNILLHLCILVSYHLLISFRKKRKGENSLFFNVPFHCCDASHNLWFLLIKSRKTANLSL
jgi:hypothetical protein